MPSPLHARVLRTTLIVPGGRRRFIEKAATAPADVIMLDLDDGVVYTDEEKTAARRLVANVLESGALAGRDVVVRTNALDTPWWRAEVTELGRLGLTAFSLAKVSSAEDLRLIDELMADQDIPPEVRLWPMMETPGSILFAEEIARVSPRVEVLIFGVGDYTAATHGQFTHGMERLSYPLGKVLCAARHHGRACLAPAFVHDDVGRLDVIRTQAAFLRQMGFDGAICMHPTHLEPINEVFSPTEEEAQCALQVVRDFEAAAQRGEAAVISNGQLIERVHVTVAMKTLAVAHRLGLVDASEVVV